MGIGFTLKQLWLAAAIAEAFSLHHKGQGLPCRLCLEIARNEFC